MIAKATRTIEPLVKAQEETYKNPTPEQVAQGAKSLSDEEIAKAKDDLIQKEYRVLLNREAAKTLDSKSLSGAEAKVWAKYNEAFDPKGEWFNISDEHRHTANRELAINVPLLAVSGGVGNLVRAGAMGIARGVSGRIVGAQIAKVGLGQGLKEAAEVGGGWISKEVAKRVAGEAAVRATGFVADGAAFQTAFVGLQGEKIWEMPDWGQQILFSCMTLGAMRAAGSVAGRAFRSVSTEGSEVFSAKQLSKISDSEIRAQAAQLKVPIEVIEHDTKLGELTSKITNKAVREVAETLMLKCHIEAAAMMVIGAAQRGYIEGVNLNDLQGTLGDIWDSLPDEALRTYLTLGGLKAGHIATNSLDITKAVLPGRKSTETPCLMSKEEMAQAVLSQDATLLAAAQKLDQAVRQIPANPKYNGVQPRALIVGGFVRDALLGLKPKDIDIEVYGVSPEQLIKVLSETFNVPINMTGKSFQVLKVALGNGYDIDVSMPRTDSKSGTGHKGFVTTGNPSLSVKEAARRRDFSMNSIAADPVTGEVLDPYGGVNELLKGQLRATDLRLFKDDPLRVYRAVQFAARMKLTPDEETFTLLRAMVASGELETLPSHRVREEITKLLIKGNPPSVGLKLLKDIGITEKYFPELQILSETPQEAKYHPEGNVWNHTLMVVDAANKIIRQNKWMFTAEEQQIIMLSALCHDLGKADTTVESDGVLRSGGHEKDEAHRIDGFLSKLDVSNRVRDAVVGCSHQHMAVGKIWREFMWGNISREEYDNRVRIVLKSVYPTRPEVYLAVCEADHRGRDMEDARVPFCEDGFAFLDSARRFAGEFGKNPTTNLLEGSDLSENFGIPAGKGMGDIIKDVEAQRDKGNIRTKDDALIYVRQKCLVTSAMVRQICGIEAGPQIGEIMKDVKGRLKSGELKTIQDVTSYLVSLKRE